MNTALIVVDMQIGLFKNTKRFDAAGVIQRINAIANAVRKANGKVIFIQHEDSFLVPHTENWEILPELERTDEETVIRKKACDAFYKTELADLLEKHNISKLIFTGCATDFCVDTSIRAAASRDYKVTVVADGHTTTDRAHLSAEQIIQHHNFMWKNLILPTSRVKVIPAEKILTKLD